jgi:phosphoglycerate dehydrogenase-like enzyme
MDAILTLGLANVAEFAKMKENVIIVNTARGAIIDTEAMLDALDSGKGALRCISQYLAYPY